LLSSVIIKVHFNQLLISSAEKGVVMSQKKHCCLSCRTENQQVEKSVDFKCAYCEASYGLADVVLWYRDTPSEIKIYIEDVVGINLD